MTTNIEDRLTAALAARAETVQPEDLRPAEPPATVVPLVRRPVTWLTAAAAAVAVAALVAVPSLVDGDDGAPEPAPAPSSTLAPTVPTATPTTDSTTVPAPDASPVVPNGDEVPGGDWTVAYTYPKDYDVDGDGVADPVVIRTKGQGDLPPGVRRVEVQLSTGGVAAVLLDYATDDLTAIDPVQLDADPGQEILYFRGTVEDGEEIGVLELVDGALVDLEVPADPGLTSSPDGDFHARGWFVDGTDLNSYRTVEGGFVPGGSVPTKPPYQVDLFRWSLVDGELVADPVGTRCWDGAEQDGISAC